MIYKWTESQTLTISKSMDGGMNMEETKKPSESLSSLPKDVLLNIFSRISRFDSPILSRVSKGFRELTTSSELDASRALVGKTEDCLYVCLNLDKEKHKPRWFTLAPTPNDQKLLPIPFPNYQQRPTSSSTLVSIGSEIYIIGGLGREVLVLDCKPHQWLRLPDPLSHKWRSLPDMRVNRDAPAVEVIDSKIYVIGGCYVNNVDDWGEVYDLKTQTWEPLSSDTLDLTTQKSVVPGRLVMDGKIYDMDGLKLYYKKHICLVEIEEKVFCQICVCGSTLVWRDANEVLFWTRVTGLEGLSPNPYDPSCLISVVKSSRGRRVTVWWKEIEFCRDGRHGHKECKTEICCAEILLERRGFKEVRGVVEWSKSVFTVDGCGTGYDFSLESAIVTH